jgi:hypothetical protein
VPVVRAQRHRDVLAVRRRSGPQVEDHVVIAPRVQRTSFASACGARCVCMPRSVPRRG